MKSPAHDIALFLAGDYLGVGEGEYLGVGEFAGTEDWSINVAQEPDTPVNAITIYDTPGTGPDTDELDEFEVGFQVRVRCASYPDAYAKHEQIRDLLIYEGPLNMSSSVWSGVYMTSDIQGIGKDQNNRHILVATYRGRRSAA